MACCFGVNGPRCLDPPAVCQVGALAFLLVLLPTALRVKNGEGAAVTGYVVEAGSGPGLADITSIGINARALTFAPVPPGRYYVRVHGVNAAGPGLASNEVLVVVR